MFNTNLLDAIEDLIGPEITINPIQHLRAKGPAAADALGFEHVPWHQDAAVTGEEADDSQIITCWIPLVDATEANGCMQVVPGLNRYLPHVSDPVTRVADGALPADIEPVLAECPKGGVVFMSRFTPHSGVANRGDTIRWSLDLRYQPSGQPSGRPFYPAYIARSASNPHSVEDGFTQWCRRWDEALNKARGVVWHRTTPAEQRIPADSPYAARSVGS